MRKHNRDISKRLIEYSKVHIRNHMIEGRFKGWHLKSPLKGESESYSLEDILTRKKDRSRLTRKKDRSRLTRKKDRSRRIKVSFMPNNKEKKSARKILNQMDRLKDLGLTIGNVWMN